MKNDAKMIQNDPHGRPMAPQIDPLGVKSHVKKYALENDDFLMTFRVPKGCQMEQFRVPKRVKKHVKKTSENRYRKNVVSDAKSTPK